MNWHNKMKLYCYYSYFFQRFSNPCTSKRSLEIWDSLGNMKKRRVYRCNGSPPLVCQSQRGISKVDDPRLSHERPSPCERSRSRPSTRHVPFLSSNPLFMIPSPILSPSRARVFSADISRNCSQRLIAKRGFNWK